MTSIIPDLAQNEVWFLTGSQDLYGDDTLRQVAEQSQEVVRLLNESSDIPVTIVWKPVLMSSAVTWHRPDRRRSGNGRRVRRSTPGESG